MDLDGDARTEPSEVREFAASNAPDIAITLAVNAAHETVEERIDESEVSDTTLDGIELLLASHFLHAPDPQTGRSKTEGTSDTYLGPDDLDGLRETRHGRRAIDLDPTGALATDDAREDQTVATYPDVSGSGETGRRGI